jgi:regulator of protease activity HflC (stomatin/prohibitin superfamily)
MNAPGGTEEVDFKSFSGYLALLLALAALIAIPVHIVMSAKSGGPPNALLLIALVLTFILLTKGVYILQPNQSTLLMLFGSYRGTDYSTGLRWANPLFNKTKVSLRLRNFNS